MVLNIVYLLLLPTHIQIKVGRDVQVDLSTTIYCILNFMIIKQSTFYAYLYRYYLQECEQILLASFSTELMALVSQHPKLV